MKFELILLVTLLSAGCSLDSSTKARKPDLKKSDQRQLHFQKPETQISQLPIQNPSFQVVNVTEGRGDSVTSSRQTKINVCAYPQSLKTVVEQLTGRTCHLITRNDLTQIQQLKISNVSQKEWDLFKKEQAQYFPSLSELDVSDNPELFSLPSFVTDMVWLEKLNVSNTGIHNFGEEVCQLQNLTTLIASDNNYEGREVPFNIFCLKNLKVLDMSNSSIRYIDEYIGQLSHLEELYMSGNNLFLIPQMLSTLPHLTLVDFQNNQLKNEDLNSFQSCKDFRGDRKQECQEDLLDSIECEAVHELPFQRGEPLRQIYTNLAGQSPELLKQCENGNSTKIYCPSFITKCRYAPEQDRERCMLDEFESTRTEERHRPHRDICYITWVAWLVDYEGFPELLNKTIRGKTIREMRYVGNSQSIWTTCWDWPWEGIRTFGGWIDFAPEKYTAHPMEVFPKAYRTPGIASNVKAWRDGEGGFFSSDLFSWVPEEGAREEI